MLYEYGKRTRDSFERFLLYFGGVFNKTIIPLALVGYEMIIASQLGAMRLVGYLPSHTPYSKMATI